MKEEKNGLCINERISEILITNAACNTMSSINSKVHEKKLILVLPLKFALPPSCGRRQDEMTFDKATFDTGSSNPLL